MQPRVGGVYKALKSLSVKVDGTWRTAKQSWTKVNGQWRPINGALGKALHFQMQCSGDKANNNFHYEMVMESDFTISAGDRLVYDVYLDSATSCLGVEIILTDTTGAVREMRSESIVDQNNISSHPGTSLKNYANQQWYSRSFNLDKMAGWTMKRYGVALEEDAPATYGGYIRNIQIVNKDGRIIGDILSTTLQKTDQATLYNGQYYLSSGYSYGSLVKEMIDMY